MIPLSLLQVVVTAIMMFLGATVLSALGFGIGVTTTPVLLLVLEPQSVVVMINTVSLLLFVLIIWQNRGHLRVREMAPMSVAGLMGVPVGIFILSNASSRALSISIAALILVLTVAVAFNIRGPIPRSRLTGPLVGLVVGMMLTALGIGGPLMVLLLLVRDWPRDAVRASLSFYFLLVEGTAVAGYGVAGMFTPERVNLVLVATVPVLLGFGLATILVRRMNEALFRRAVIAVIIATSLVTLGREAMRL
jgi:uncharacterized membrane protein YfcA